MFIELKVTFVLGVHSDIGEVTITNNNYLENQNNFYSYKSIPRIGQ